MDFVIGIDGGGTKTEAVLAEADSGTVVSRFVTGAANPHAITFEKTGERLAEILDRVLDQPEFAHTTCRAVCLGLSGVSRVEEIRRIREIVDAYAEKRGQTWRTFVQNDAEIALMAAFGKPNGVIVISGTGSIVYGITADGRKFRVGGWGHLLGDQGSGYIIGLNTMKAAMQSFDGVLPATLLTGIIQEEYSLPSLDDLKQYIYLPKIEKGHVAAFAPLCIRAAELGDPVAAGILEEAAKELAVQAVTLRRKDPWFENQTEVAVSGSLFTHSRIFRQAFEQELSREASGLELAVTERSPAEGAARLGIYLLGQSGHPLET